jgi:ABC-type dipeptide/oligopeptide/nickel transport system ATPase subunit
VLEIKDLSVKTSQKEILKNLHLTAVGGEITGIVGKSGSGKSTLFKVILGIPELVSKFQITGSVEWKGVPLSKFKTKPVQPVFQDPYSFFSPYLTIRKSLLEPLYIREGVFVSKKDISQELEQICDLFQRFQLKQALLDKKTNQLSGGQLQRLAILRAILAKPELILLDEPVTALDALVQAEIIHLIQELNKEQRIGFILVSHDLGLVKNLSDSLYILDEGNIIESGKTREIFLNPKTEFTKQLIRARDLSTL